jgi:hypothetical protein
LFQKRKKEKGKREKRKYSHGGSSPLVCLRKMEKKKEKGKRKNPRNPRIVGRAGSV